MDSASASEADAPTPSPAASPATSRSHTPSTEAKSYPVYLSPHHPAPPAAAADAPPATPAASASASAAAAAPGTPAASKEAALAELETLIEAVSMMDGPSAAAAVAAVAVAAATAAAATSDSAAEESDAERIPALDGQRMPKIRSSHRPPLVIPVDAAAPALPYGHAQHFRATGICNGPHIDVYFYLPRSLKKLKDPKVLFVIHGKGGRGKVHRDTWRPLADAGGFIVLAPTFAEELFPQRSFQQGGVLGEDGQLRDRNMWTFYALENIFDLVKRLNGFETERYSVYGHSAGAQFASRLAILMPPSCRVHKIVAANAGSYTFFDFKVGYPFGLAIPPRASREPGTVLVDEKQIKLALSREFTVLLGTADTDPQCENLPNRPGQGPHRLARGANFYASAASRLRHGDKFNWRLVTVDGVGHHSHSMSRFTGNRLELLF